jgi:predicted oxidoreductase
MKTYRIRNSDLEVSRIGYGCMHLSRAWDGTPLTTEEGSRTHAMIDTALAQGINLFDHADIYARGKSERLFGEVLRQRPSLRGQIVLQSKCGIRLAGDPEPGAPARYDFSHAHIVASVEASLQRLCTDYLDILLLHRPDPLAEPEEVARAFDALHQAGKVRNFGVSNHAGTQIALLQRHVQQPLVINQVELSLLHHYLIDEGITANQVGAPYSATGTLDYCRQHDILVQAWSPLASGRLAAPLESMDETLRTTAELALQLAQTHGVQMEAILLAWLLRHPAGIQPIAGTTHPERLIASCAGDTIELTREQWYALFAAARGRRVP